MAGDGEALRVEFQRDVRRAEADDRTDGLGIVGQDGGAGGDDSNTHEKPHIRSHRAKSRCPSGSRRPDGCLDFARHERERADAKGKGMSLRLQTLRQGHIAPPCRNTNPISSRSEEHTSELKSLMRITYAVFFFTKQ